MKRKIKILYVTAEISPYASAGGLGEVGRSLPKALQESGLAEVLRVMPLYKQINKNLKYVTDFPVKLGEGYETCILKKDKDSLEPATYFIQNERYYYRDNIYGYEDDGLRFFYFCQAVVEMLKKISFQPDIVHLNDWHTGFLPVLLKAAFPKIKTLFTIHNISYQGFIPSSYLKHILPEEELYCLGYPQWLNFMRAAIKYADLVTTVSPGYAREIQSTLSSSGIGDLLMERSNQPVGILNGIEYESYDPSGDGVLDAPYDWEHIERKQLNRTWLRKYYGLPDEEVPLLAMITRLEATKGMELIIKVLSCTDLSRFQLVILGSGSSLYQDVLTCISKAYPDRIAVDFKYTPEQAKRIYGAADIYLMPSQTEPCGLGQLYAMRYGAVPIVNPVGGLQDTVVAGLASENSSGFYMREWSGEALAEAIEQALQIYNTPAWKLYVRNGMQCNSSWKRSVSEYLNNYQQLLER